VEMACPLGKAIALPSVLAGPVLQEPLVLKLARLPLLQAGPGDPRCRSLDAEPFLCPGVGVGALDHLTEDTWATSLLKDRSADARVLARDLPFVAVGFDAFRTTAPIAECELLFAVPEEPAADESVKRRRRDADDGVDFLRAPAGRWPRPGFACALRVRRAVGRQVMRPSGCVQGAWCPVLPSRHSRTPPD
jgi:hypothetical protein